MLVINQSQSTGDKQVLLFKKISIPLLRAGLRARFETLFLDYPINPRSAVFNVNGRL